MRRAILFSTILFSLFLFTNCGGGTTVTNTPPTVDAGTNRTVHINTATTLTGTGSDAEGTISYQWAEGAMLLSDSASFSYTPTTVGAHTLTLTVTDTDGATATDTVIVTATDPVLYVSFNSDADYQCDGIDDHIEINEALARVAADENYTTVYLRGPYTYEINDTVIIDSHTILTGDTDATLKLIDHAGWWAPSKPLIGQKNRVAWDPWGDANDSISYTEIHGFSISGGVQAEPAGSIYLPLITFYNPSHISIHDMNLEGGQWDGIRITNASGDFPIHSSIHHNKIQETGHEGICFVGVTHFEVYNNMITSTRTNSGIRAKNTNHFSLHDNIIGNSLAKRPSGYAGILLENASQPINDAEIHGNTIYGKNGGIHLMGSGGTYDIDTRRDVHIHHNFIYKTNIVTTSSGVDLDGGIKIDGYQHTLVEHNIIDGGVTDGIVYEGTSGGDTGYETIVRNNIIINNSGYGINNKEPAVHTFTENNDLIYNNTLGDHNNTSLTDTIHTDPLFASSHSTLDQWFHIVASYDNASETFKIYINGKEHTSRTIHGFGTIGISTKNLYLGNYRGIAYGFHGREDELAIWDRALSPAEIDQLYYNGTPVNIEGAITNGMQAYFKMENNWQDSSGNGFNAEDNTSGFSTDAIAGGHAGLFAGNDYVQYPTSLSTVSGITISAWVNRSQITDTEQTILNKGSQGNNDHIWLYFRKEVLRFELGNGTDRRMIEALLINPWEMDHHLRSQGGRWDGTQWVTDADTSPCIDAGYDDSDYSSEPLPNGDRVNIGLYGNTSEASKSH